MPATGGTSGGYATGEALAYLFLKFLRDDAGERENWHLGLIVKSLMIRLEEEGGMRMETARNPSDDYLAVSAQCFGFIDTLAVCLTAGAKYLGHYLDGLNEADLVDQANAGLGFDAGSYDAYLKALCKQQRESGEA